MKKHLLLTFLVVFTLQFNGHAQLIDQWTFTNDPVENSDSKNKAISTWDPDLAGNSWAAGVLTWGYDNTAEYVSSSGAYQGATWLGATGGTLSKLELVIDTKDINFSVVGAYGWQFTGASGAIPNSKKVAARIYHDSAGNVSLRIAGGADEWNGDVAYNQNDYTSITDLRLTFTWDFTNNAVSVAASGSGVLAAGGTGTISYTNSNTTYDLSGVTGLNSFRTHQQAYGDSYIQLDTVAILANGATLSTSKTVLDSAKVWYSKGDNALHIRGVEADSVKSVKVYSITGALASEYVNPGNDIALGDLSSGLYIASVLSEHGAKAFKFVK